MVIEREKPKQEEKTQDEARVEMLEELSKEPDVIVSLAYFYAKSFEQYGEDVTKRWQNAVLQNDALNRAYAKGWEEGRRYEADKNNKGTNNSNRNGPNR